MNWYENFVSESARAASPVSCDRLKAPATSVMASWPVPDCWVAVPPVTLVVQPALHAEPFAPPKRSVNSVGSAFTAVTDSGVLAVVLPAASRAVTV